MIVQKLKMIEDHPNVQVWLTRMFQQGSPGEAVEVKSIFSQKGDYCGGIDFLPMFLKMQCQPEKINSSSDICRIGFSEKQQKWYGWSQRGFYGFAIGSEVEEGDCAADSGWTEEYLQDHPEEDFSLPVGFKAMNLYDCRRIAVAFAKSIG